jgi:hypothetical protein
VLPPGENPLPLGRAAPAPIEPTKDELRALTRKLGIETPPSENVLVHIVARAVFDTGDPVPALVRVAKALGQVMRRPPEHGLQIMAPALKRSGSRELFGQVRRAFEAEAASK